MIGVVDLERLVDLPPEALVGQHLTAQEPMLGVDDGLDDALGALADHHRDWAPVVADGRLTGILSVQDAMAAYRTALDGNVRQVRGLRAGGMIVEAEITPGSTLADCRVADIAWPRTAVLVAIERGEALLVPRGDLVIEARDRLSIFADEAAGAELDVLLRGREVSARVVSPAAKARPILDDGS